MKAKLVVILSIAFLAVVLPVTSASDTVSGVVVAWGDNSYGQCDLPSQNQKFIALSASAHNLGLRADGTVVAWGNNNNGQCNVPYPNSWFSAIAAGHVHSLGLKSNGEIVAWGSNYFGQCNLPSPNTNFASVAAGSTHSLGLRTNGVIVAWGDNDYGQCNIPYPNYQFTAVAAGISHSLGLKSDGSIIAWGSNVFRQCSVPAPNSGFVAIASGGDHGLGLKSDGSIVAWGSNSDGQLNVPSPNSDFIAIAAGGYHSLGLKSDGTVVAWGNNSYGQCNLPSPNEEFTSIAAGHIHSLGLRTIVPKVGTLSFSPGAGKYSEPIQVTISCATEAVVIRYTTDGSEPDESSPIYSEPIAVDKTLICRARAWKDEWKPSDLAAALYTIVQETGSVAAWGNSSNLEMFFPLENRGFTAVTACGPWGALCLKEDGSIERCAYQRFVPLPNEEFTAVAASSRLHVCLKSDRSIISWDGALNLHNIPAPNADFVAVAAGEDFGLGLKSDGSIVTWGYNYSDVPSPNTGFLAIAAGFYHGLGLKADGSIVAWGNNTYGQCNIPSPNADFVAVAGGYGHSLGLKSDGSIVAWGSNTYGQCDIPSPNADFVAVAGGYDHSLGLKSDGSIVGWGYNLHGQCTVPWPDVKFTAISAYQYISFGLAPAVDRPRLIPDAGKYTESLLVQIVCDTEDAIIRYTTDGSKPTETSPEYVEPILIQSTTIFRARAWKESLLPSDIAHATYQIAPLSGSVVAWGLNSYSQCDVPSPNTGFTAVSAGEYHSLGLKSDGAIVAWGDNTNGQCNVPVPHADFIQVAAGNVHSLGLKSDGSILAWGNNHNGQCDVPAPNSGFVAVAAGAAHSLGLKSDGSIVAWGFNMYDQCRLPTPNAGFAAINAGTSHNIGLLTDGFVRYGTGWVYPPIYLGLAVTAVAAGDHTLILTSSGQIHGWGGTTGWSVNPPNPNTEFIAVAAGRTHSLGLKSNGSVVAWGKNDYGQCDVPSPNTGYIAIAGGINHSLGIITHMPVSIQHAKQLADGSVVRIDSMIVSAAWDNTFYIEEDNRSSGIRVQKEGHGLCDGMRVNVVGEVCTNSDGERFVEAEIADSAGSGLVIPLSMTNKSLGGGDYCLSEGGCGQDGVWSWQWVDINGGSDYQWKQAEGLNNIGLLIKAYGRITQIGDGYLYIDDGSKLDDGLGSIGVRVVCNPAEYEVGDYLVVTGISSCFRTPNGLVRRILVQTEDDITRYTDNP